MTSTRAPPICRRCWTGSGPNAENSGAKTLRFLSVPIAEVYSSRIRPQNANTRSPFTTPRPLNTFAKRLLRALSSA